MSNISESGKAMASSFASFDQNLEAFKKVIADEMSKIGFEIYQRHIDVIDMGAALEIHLVMRLKK